MIKTCLCGARPLTPIAKVPRNARSQFRFMVIAKEWGKDMEIRLLLGMEECTSIKEAEYLSPDVPSAKAYLH